MKYEKVKIEIDDIHGIEIRLKRPDKEEKVYMNPERWVLFELIYLITEEQEGYEFVEKGK